MSVLTAHRTVHWGPDTLLPQLPSTARRDRPQRKDRPGPGQGPAPGGIQARAAHRTTASPEIPGATVDFPIRQADASDLDLIADLLGEAYHNLAPLGRIIRSPFQRAQVLPAYLRIHVEHALTLGDVHLTVDQSAVAVWLPHHTSGQEPVNYHTRRALACGQYADHFHTLEAALAAHRPLQSHNYLALLAVRPGQQCHGRGSALLRHQHAYLDAKDIPSYLHSSDPRHRDLYQRHGYDVCREPIVLAHGIPGWPMWRDPTASAPNHATTEAAGDTATP